MSSASGTKSTHPGNNHLVDEPSDIVSATSIQLPKTVCYSLVEPPIGHNKETPVAGRIPPRILNFVPNRLATRIEVDGRDDHRVRHRALPSLQPLRLGRRERDPQRAPVVEQVEVHDPQRRVGELADVAAEEQRLARFERLQVRVSGQWSRTVTRSTHCNHGFLHPLSCRIDVRNSAPAPHVSELVHRVQLSVLVPRVVDQRDALDGRELLRAELLIELPWGAGP